MRRLIFAALLCAVGSPGRADDPPAIPQDPAAQEARRKDRLAWHRATTVEAYDRVGKRDPKWDTAARRALTAFAESWALPWFPAKEQTRTADEAARQAVAAGCDDPLIEYVVGRNLYDFTRPADAADRRLVAAAAALAKSQYPPVRRAHALVNAAGVTLHPRGRQLTEVDRRAARQMLDDCLALVVEVLRDPHPEARRQAYSVCETAVAHYALLAGNDWAAGLDAVRPALARSPRAVTLAQSLAGHAHVQAAWQARGRGTYDTVPE
jgi:hypothetical protein